MVKILQSLLDINLKGFEMITGNHTIGLLSLYWEPLFFWASWRLPMELHGERHRNT